MDGPQHINLLFLIYIIKQDIHVYMLPLACQTARPNGLTFFCEHSWVDGGCLRRFKKINMFFQKKNSTANAASASICIQNIG